MNSLLSTAYWPNLHYFYYLLNSEAVIIEQFDSYQKQSYRNRCTILSANGPLDLSIPVKNAGRKIHCGDLQISYAENWPIKHWRAITSAYKNSPYFEHFENEIHEFYMHKYENLVDYNLKQLETVFKIMRMKKNITVSAAFEKNPVGVLDLREKIHPKLGYTEDNIVATTLGKSYYQTFENKFEFAPNLSILDLVFNTGLGALDYLRSAE